MWTLIVWFTLTASTAQGTIKEPGRATYHTPDKVVCQKWQAEAVNLSNQIGPGFIVVRPCQLE